jgi:hypothetical protein
LLLRAPGSRRSRRTVSWSKGGGSFESGPTCPARNTLCASRRRSASASVLLPCEQPVCAASEKRTAFAARYGEARASLHTAVTPPEQGEQQARELDHTLAVSPPGGARQRADQRGPTPCSKRTAENGGRASPRAHRDAETAWVWLRLWR